MLFYCFSEVVYINGFNHVNLISSLNVEVVKILEKEFDVTEHGNRNPALQHSTFII